MMGKFELTSWMKGGIIGVVTTFGSAFIVPIIGPSLQFGGFNPTVLIVPITIGAIIALLLEKFE